MSSVSCGLVGFSCIICRLSRSRRTRYGHKKLIREKIRESHKEKPDFISLLDAATHPRGRVVSSE